MGIDGPEVRRTDNGQARVATEGWELISAWRLQSETEPVGGYVPIVLPGPDVPEEVGSAIRHTLGLYALVAVPGEGAGWVVARKPDNPES